MSFFIISKILDNKRIFKYIKKINFILNILFFTHEINRKNLILKHPIEYLKLT